MKVLNDGTKVRAILWYLALEYKDHLLSTNNKSAAVSSLRKHEFLKFVEEALEHFKSEVL